MSERQREILNKVAKGELSPEEADALLADLEAAGSPHTPPPPTPEPELPDAEAEATRPGTSGTTGLHPPTPPSRLRVVVRATRVRVVGDPNVTAAVAEGPHSIRRADNGELVIECGPIVGHRSWFDEPLGAFATVGGGERRQWRRQQVWQGWIAGPHSVDLRVNPTVPLEIEVVAGAATIEHIDAPISCEVSAGSLRLRDVHGPLTGSASAGSLAVDTVLAAGEWRLTSDMGGLSVRLRRGSSVRVRAGATLGRAEVTGAQAMGPGEWTVGAGEARLEATANLGSVTVLAE